jgi:hypothetical protein
MHPSEAASAAVDAKDSQVEIVVALLLSFGLAAWFRLREWPAPRAIAVACLLAPAAVTFAAYVFPADPEFRRWWQSTVVTSFFFGLLAAGAGYWLAVMMQGSESQRE